MQNYYNAKLSLIERSGLETKFDQLRQNIELTQNQREKIITSHTALRAAIEKLPYVQSTFLTGSYKKNTMIRPPNDVDMFVILKADQASLQPQSVLDKLKKDIATTYSNSTIRQDRPCVVVDLAHCKFELTPVIKASLLSIRYKIPQKKILEVGLNWFEIPDPNVFGTRLTQRNEALNGKLVPLIKMMKKMKAQNGLNNIKSFEMEQKAVDELNSIYSYRDGVEQLMKIYGWNDHEIPNFYSWLSALNDKDFAAYCRTSLFGTDFPA